MLLSNTPGLIVSRKISAVKKFLKFCYFSGEVDKFIGKIKLLERLKTGHEISNVIYKCGRYILFLKGEMVLLKGNDKLVIKSYGEIQNFNKEGTTTTILLDVLNETNNICLFAVNLQPFENNNLRLRNKENDEKFVAIRHCLYFLNKEEANFIAHATGLINFKNSYNFCCYCGGNLKTKESGHQKICLCCKCAHYPSLSPVGLTLIENENHEEVLLVRQERHPPGTYTCVAGFIELGESLESNIKREVAEEVGLNVTKVEYCSSQHWALPTSQLSLGCIATTSDKHVTIDHKEIQDAKWVRANELKNAVIRIRELKSLADMNDKNIWAPPPNTISHEMMVYWLRKYHDFDSTSTSLE